MILLDTHVLIWTLTDPVRLSKPAASAIRRARQSDGLAISAMTLFEIAILIERRRIRSYGTVEGALEKFIEGVSIRPITPQIAVLAAQFPDDYPRDLGDRLIGGTARAEGLTLVTRDENIRKSPLLRTVW